MVCVTSNTVHTHFSVFTVDPGLKDPPCFLLMAGQTIANLFFCPYPRRGGKRKQKDKDEYHFSHHGIPQLFLFLFQQFPQFIGLFPDVDQIKLHLCPTIPMGISRAEMVTALPHPDAVKLKHSKKESLDIRGPNIKLRVRENQSSALGRMRHSLCDRGV